MMLLAFAALALSAQEKKDDGPCDQVHGIGCIVQAKNCEGCPGKAVYEGKLCEACAKARKACSMCARAKRFYTALADVEISDGAVRLVCRTDPYSREVPEIEKNSAFKDSIRKRDDGRVTCFVTETPQPLEARAGRKVYIRFSKIDAAGGPPGKFEFAILQRRVRVESVVDLDAALVVQVKGPLGTVAPGIRVRLLEEACAACKRSEASELESVDFRQGIEFRLPPAALDHGFAVEHLDAAGKTMIRKGPFRFQDGRWTLDGRGVASPYDHTGRE